jgi:hypothetical protein
VITKEMEEEGYCFYLSGLMLVNLGLLSYCLSNAQADTSPDRKKTEKK